MVRAKGLREAPRNGLALWHQVALAGRPFLNQPERLHHEEAAVSVALRLRRTDLSMPQERVIETLEHGYCGRLATVGADGFPYCVPLLYVWADDRVFLHTARARGHLRANLELEKRVCFVVDEPGAVFPYGRFECDTTVAYRSVTLFGRVGAVDELVRTVVWPPREEETIRIISARRANGKERKQYAT